MANQSFASWSNLPFPTILGTRTNLRLNQHPALMIGLATFDRPTADFCEK
jgi:hypothetical protein